jgi:hypothetical protein
MSKDIGSQPTCITSVICVINSCAGENSGDFQKFSKFAKFPLTHRSSLLLFASRDTAGPVPSADSVFFSGSASQFSAVIVLGWVLSCTRRMIFDSVVADSNGGNPLMRKSANIELCVICRSSLKKGFRSDNPGTLLVKVLGNESQIFKLSALSRESIRF